MFLSVYASTTTASTPLSTSASFALISLSNNLLPLFENSYFVPPEVNVVPDQVPAISVFVSPVVP